MIEIFTDGSSRGNPGPGGYATILKYKHHYKELSGGFRKTTNNRMELLAVIIGLESVTDAEKSITVYSDSKYVVDSINKGWVFGWVKKGFKDKKNPDLWQRFLKVNAKRNAKFEWVKGHAGHKENERCDVLAVNAALNTEKLEIDEGFENTELGLF